MPSFQKLCVCTSLLTVVWTQSVRRRQTTLMRETRNSIKLSRFVNSEAMPSSLEDVEEPTSDNDEDSDAPDENRSQDSDALDESQQVNEAEQSNDSDDKYSDDDLQSGADAGADTEGQADEDQAQRLTASEKQEADGEDTEKVVNAFVGNDNEEKGRKSLGEHDDRDESLEKQKVDHYRDEDSRAGSKSSYEITQGPSGHRIPKIVHHVYKSDLTKLHREWPNEVWYESFLSWKEYFPEPEYRHIFWTDDYVDSFFQTNCSKHWNMYAKLKVEIERSDMSRYCILWKMGGVYADLDYEPLTNFYHLFSQGRVNLVQSPYPGETVQNSLMASPANHHFWDDLMSFATEHMHDHDDMTAKVGVLLDGAKQTMVTKGDVVLWLSGPRLLSNFIRKIQQDIVFVLPCNQFQRVTHSGETNVTQVASGRHCKTLSEFDSNDKTIQGIHWGTVSWGNGSSMDNLFHKFHVLRPGDEMKFWKDQWSLHDESALEEVDREEEAKDAQ